MRGQSCLKAAPIKRGSRLSGCHTGREREKLKMTSTSGLEEREAGDGIVQVNFHPWEFREATVLFSYSKM